MEWKRLIGKAGYIMTGRALVLTYHLSESEMVLFDSGSSYSEEFLDLVKRMKVRVCAVLNSHLHSDHTAHNRILHEIYGTQIYAPAKEVDVLRHPKRMAYEWGIESETWQREFLTAHPYSFHEIQTQERSIELYGQTFQVLALPGHTKQHTGYVTPDGVCYLGDAMLSHSLVKFAKMPAMLDEKKSLQTMERIKTFTYPCFALAHREIVQGAEIADLAEQNIQKEYGILREMSAVLDESDTIDEAVEKVMDHLNIHPVHEREWMLTKSSIEKKIMYLKNREIDGKNIE